MLGWKFCSMLDGAKIDSFVYVYSFSGSIASSNPRVGEIVSLIETEAKRLFTRLDSLNLLKKLDHLDLMRFSCLSSISGANSLVNLTDERWLYSLNPVYYFPFLWTKVGLERNSRISTPFFGKTPIKPRYKIAYQILTHEIKSFRNVRSLVEKLDSIDSIILIHVDLKSVELRRRTEELILKRERDGKRGNVFIQKVSFGVIWGTYEIVSHLFRPYFYRPRPAARLL
jgi:hypothetical protein